MADLKVAMNRAGHKFGSVVDPSDVQALLAPLALGAPQSDVSLEQEVDDARMIVRQASRRSPDRPPIKGHRDAGSLGVDQVQPNRVAGVPAAATARSPSPAHATAAPLSDITRSWIVFS